MSKRVMRECPQQRVGKPSVLPALLRYFKPEKRSQRKPGMHSRSFTPRSMAQYQKFISGKGISGEETVARELFFDLAVGTGCKIPVKGILPPIVTAQVAHPVAKVRPSRRRVAPQDAGASKSGSSWNRGSRPEGTAGPSGDDRRRSRPPREGDHAAGAADDDDWVPDFLEDMFDNSDRHAVGMGLLERMFGGSKKSEAAKKERTRRPYFTYWVTCIQVVIFFVTVATYGFAPVGLDVKEVTAEIRMTSLSIEQVSINEKRNMWVGPRQSDLIHLGAKYTPCMRPDPRIDAAVAADSAEESQTACCIYNDNSGCVQTLEKDCSPTLSTWLKWTSSNLGYQNRTSGSVCGEDPKYCADPASTGSFTWKDDITEWPLCDSALNVTASDENYHMTCEVVGRPCCVGIQGECIISTREYCQFRRGYFHEDASLCSQVYCMKDICGMLAFSDPAKPDQFYRLFFSLFLHAGLLQLAITVFLQMTVMRDFEKVTGWWFMTIVYLVGGVAGSLASAIFIPYHVEAGPSGSQFAVLAVVFVEVLRWNKDRAPGATIAKLFIVFGVLFFLGMILSDVDNFAHLFGFLFGILVCFGFRPYLTVCGATVSDAGRLAGVAVCLLLAVALFAILVMVFYLAPVNNCHNCMYFNCIPFTSTYCADQDVSIRNATDA